MRLFVQRLLNLKIWWWFQRFNLYANKKASIRVQALWIAFLLYRQKNVFWNFGRGRYLSTFYFFQIYQHESSVKARNAKLRSNILPHLQSINQPCYRQQFSFYCYHCSFIHPNRCSNRKTRDTMLAIFAGRETRQRIHPKSSTSHRVVCLSAPISIFRVQMDTCTNNTVDSSHSWPRTIAARRWRRPRLARMPPSTARPLRLFHREVQLFHRSLQMF